MTEIETLLWKKFSDAMKLLEVQSSSSSEVVLKQSAVLQRQSEQIELLSKHVSMLSEQVSTLSQEVQILTEEVRHPPGPQGTNQ